MDVEEARSGVRSGFDDIRARARDVTDVHAQAQACIHISYLQAGEPVPAAPESLATVVHSRVGRRFAIVLPFEEANGVKNEYTFWFRVDDASVKALEQP